ncbi:hypothetical protein [Methylobacterium aerolatum]|uniref:Uncharacterized protein n=1 Tax=Methylobacterium aerolatum TaxID=418708 RepID=A0ABU0I4F9_9HYPH|nr:hypothetical protein [Methylobacterium aerolatum]MDQ0449498.1 hypothetical protein [Methylobacterium aerolatum]GJD33529.1 hypothetical protein FMGBMHLM_0417 [Methylobacterium aerolatum]
MPQGSFDIAADERRLERSVAAALRIIDAAQIERQAPPVRHARDRLTKVYRLMQLARAKERLAV